jgi:hypothetical protein
MNAAPMKNELSPWFEPGVEPVHEGVYRRQFPGGPYSCWAQGRWYGDAASPDAAAATGKPSRHAKLPWAGLSSPPDAPCFRCRGHGVIDLGVDAESDADLIELCPEC